jgi:hypothetical protein
MDMDMGTNQFQKTNMALARDFWYIIAVVMGTLLSFQAVNYYQSQIRCVALCMDSSKRP